MESTRSWSVGWNLRYAGSIAPRARTRATSTVNGSTGTAIGAPLPRRVSLLKKPMRSPRRCHLDARSLVGVGAHHRALDDDRPPAVGQPLDLPGLVGRQQAV